jgi:hypothetical protein
MPGAWEQHQHRVLGAILHVDTVTVAWAFGLRNLQIPGQFIGLAGMPYDMARNQACQQALQYGFSHVFFLDSDVVPPRDAVPRLLARDADIVSGVYCRRSPPHGIPVMLKNGDWVRELPDPKSQDPMLEVDVVGAGCLLIKRGVLEKFFANPDPRRPEKPVFDWRVDAQHLFPPGQALSEDFTMCMRAKTQFGYKVLVDTSVRCRHIGYAQADYHSFVPVDSTSST